MLDYYRRSHTVAGVEIDDLCVAACGRLGIDCLKGDFLEVQIDGRYDVVMAWHCLEHVSDINSFLSKMVRIANVKGLIIVEIPIDRPLARKSFGGHVHYFTRDSLQKLADRWHVECLYAGEGVQKPAYLFIGQVQ